MKIEITNRQKIKRVSLKNLRKKLTQAGSASSKKISFVLCDNRFIKRLNKRYFKKSHPTDVISFPLEDDFDPNYLGEVVVSVEEAVKAAKGCWQEELLLYCIHGILHLFGYDDRTKSQKQRMERKQEKILRKII